MIFGTTSCVGMILAIVELIVALWLFGNISEAGQGSGKYVRQHVDGFDFGSWIMSLACLDTDIVGGGIVYEQKYHRVQIVKA